MRLSTSLLAALTVAPCLATQHGAADQEIAAKIDEILARPAARRSHWGVLAHDLDAGSIVYERNAGQLFLPASNVKLYSTALALTRLGPGYTFATRVTAQSQVDDDGVLQGDLLLIGGGDPNLSSRRLPYRNQTLRGPDRLEPMRELARQIWERGVRRVAGDVVGDDSRYVWQPYPRGWGYADTLQGYGSPVSALVFNDNLVELRVTPGGPGDPARLLAGPALAHYRLVNLTRTVSSQYVTRGLAVRRGNLPGEVVLSGQIPSRSRGRRYDLSASDPALYAAQALARALADLGIVVEGEAKARHQAPDRLPSLRSGPGAHTAPGSELASASSVALAEAIRVVNKVSQNLHAEMLLREVALHESGVGSYEAALAALRDFLAAAGLNSAEHALRDGSGLSRHNLLAPSATVRLLEFMWESEHRQPYLDSLPLAGVDGTLDWRFRRSPGRARIRAKTGSMTNVLALSGYAEAPGGRNLAFSILANNFGYSASSTRHLMDSVADALVTAPSGGE